MMTLEKNWNDQLRFQSDNVFQNAKQLFFFLCNFLSRFGYFLKLTSAKSKTAE